MCNLKSFLFLTLLAIALLASSQQPTLGSAKNMIIAGEKGLKITIKSLQGTYIKDFPKPEVAIK